jgi:glutathione synthase/RimK-type ligase-like ATP-grasp enzyme
VNPVAHLSNSIKSVASARLRAAGVPMPKVVPVSDARTLPEGLSFPVIAREDRRHGGPMHLCRDERELANVPWHALHEPVVVEYRDVQSPDGWFRKWRYLVAGESGAPRHLVISRRWVVKAQRRVQDEAVMREELAYTSQRQDPHQEILVRGAKALGLDVVAFDYARTRDGELVVFEPNPFATLWASFNSDARYAYQRPCVERLYATLCAFWLERAGLLPEASKELRELAG